MALETFSLKDAVTIAALFLGPMVAVLITLWFQRRAQKRAAKQRLFMVLMANRKRAPTIEWVNALNLIDVVFSDDVGVVESWHRMYDVLCMNPLPAEKLAHANIELLSDIAHSLGYRYLQQTDIDKFYAPTAFAEQAHITEELVAQFLRVLRSIPNPP